MRAVLVGIFLAAAMYAQAPGAVGLPGPPGVTGLTGATGPAPCTTNGAIFLNTATSTPGCLSPVSGGIPYGSSSTSVAYSGVLGANQVVVGGGAGAGPSTPGGTLTSTLLTVPSSLVTASTDNTYNMKSTLSGSIGAYQGWAFTNNTGATIYAGIQLFNDAANDSGMRFKTWAGTLGGTELLTLTGASQRAGLGTNAPLSKLDINGNLCVGTCAGTTAAPANGLLVSGQAKFSSPVNFSGTNTTAAFAGVIGTTCPAVTCTAAYTWVQAVSSDGSTVYFPVWK